ncbi:terminase small subunit [Hungatella hathewayi]|nr:terminase small subunit [Hungatella hathewayi]
MYQRERSGVGNQHISGEANVRKRKASVRKISANAQKRKRRSEKKEEVIQVIENPNLTDKQRLFCIRYVRCFNATRSYQKAYNSSYETAMVEGCKLLRNPKVRAEITRLKQDRLNREMLDEHDIFQKYMDIAFSDITDYVEFGREEIQAMGAFGPIQVEDPATGKKVPLMKTVNSVRFRESDVVDGTIITEVKQGRDGASIKLADRMKALEWLADHMDLATPEQRARIDHIQAQTGKIIRESAGGDNGDGVEVINDAPQADQDIRDDHTEVSSAV